MNMPNFEFSFGNPTKKIKKTKRKVKRKSKSKRNPAMKGTSRKRDTVGNGRGKANKKAIKRTQVAVAKMSNMNPVRSTTRGNSKKNPKATAHARFVKSKDTFQHKIGKSYYTKPELNKAEKLMESDKEMISILSRKVKMKSLTASKKKKMAEQLREKKKDLTKLTSLSKKMKRDIAASKKKGVSLKKAGYKALASVQDKSVIRQLSKELKKGRKAKRKAEKVGISQVKKRKKVTKRKVTKKKVTKRKVAKKKVTKRKVAKKKVTKRKVAKKKVTKRKVAKKKVTKRKVAKKKVTKRKTPKKRKAKKSITSASATKKVSKIFSGKTKMKKKQKAKFKIKTKGKKKTRNYSVTKTNPYSGGKSMKYNPSKIEEVLGHSTAEMVGLVAGGGMHNVVNKAAIKYAPGFVSTMMSLPVVGQFTTSLIPMLIGAGAGMAAEKISDQKTKDYVKEIAKGTIGAALAGMGSALSQVVTKPMGLEGYRGVDLTPMGNVDLTPLGFEESAADFGGVDLTPMGGVDLTPMNGEESPADFGKWDEALDDNYGSHDTALDDNYGQEESPADFGDLDMSEDFY